MMSGNAYGQWKTCQRCGLRLEYIPYTDSSGQYQKKEDPNEVKDALNYLKTEHKVWDNMTHRMVRYAQDMLESHNRLEREIYGPRRPSRTKPPPSTTAPTETPTAEERPVGEDSFEQEGSDHSFERVDMRDSSKRQQPATPSKARTSPPAARDHRASKSTAASSEQPGA